MGMDLTDGVCKKVVVIVGREAYGGDGKAEAVRFSSTLTTIILRFLNCVEYL